MLSFTEYTEFLDQQLKEHGLKHGFELFTEGEFYRHYIYIDDGVESRFFGLVKKPRRIYVAEIVSEPNSIVPFMQGARKSPLVLCEILQSEYTQSVRSVINAVNALVIKGGETTFLSSGSELNVIKWV